MPDSPAIDPQALQAALAQLHDISLPAAPSGWPLALGWWLLLSFLLAAVAVVFAGRWWWRKTALRRAAQQHLASVLASQHELSDPQFLQALAATLRRAAKAKNSKAASLVGQSWADYLNHTGQTDFFTSEAGMQLLQARFAPVVSANRRAQIAAVEHWLKVAL